MKFRLILAAISLVIIAAACAPEPQILSDRFLPDTSFLMVADQGDDTACVAPCWRGITPGETTWNEARDIIEEAEDLTDWQTRTDDETGQIGAAWAPVDGDTCCQMFTQDGSTVSLILTQTTPEATFAEVIEIYGEPAYIIGETVTSDQALVSVYYPDVPMLIYLFVAGEDGAINGSNQVVGFAYMTEELMDLLLVTSDLHEWEGFNTYNAYIESDFEVTPSVTLTPVNGE